MHHQSDLCCVCGSLATGMHYDVVSCEACKSFFRRSMVQKARYSCLQNGYCVVDQHTRISCKFCRLQKCISAGMKQEALRLPNTQSAKNLHANTPEQLPNTQSAKNLHANTPEPLLLYDEIVISNCMVSNSSWVSDGTSTEHRGDCSSNIACGMNNKCEQPVTSLRPPLQQESSMFGVHEEIEELGNILKCVSRWAATVISFQSLSPKCQEKLLESSWWEICVLKIAIMQIVQDSSTFVFSNGCAYTMEQIQDKRYLELLCDIKHHVSSWLNYMNLDRAENGHLMTLLLLNPDAKGLNTETVKTLLDMQKKSLESLQRHIQKEHFLAPGRMPQLLMRLGSIKTLSVEFRQWAASNKLKFVDNNFIAA